MPPRPPGVHTHEAWKAQVLVQELLVGTPFDALPKGADGRRSWEATPQQRLERLLKENEHPIGLLWNGAALRFRLGVDPLEPLLVAGFRQGGFASAVGEVVAHAADGMQGLLDRGSFLQALITQILVEVGVVQENVDHSLTHVL